jgi:hypothetical protein
MRLSNNGFTPISPDCEAYGGEPGGRDWVRATGYSGIFEYFMGDLCLHPRATEY